MGLCDERGQQQQACPQRPSEVTCQGMYAPPRTQCMVLGSCQPAVGQGEWVPALFREVRDRRCGTQRQPWTADCGTMWGTIAN